MGGVPEFLSRAASRRASLPRFKVQGLKVLQSRARRAQGEKFAELLEPLSLEALGPQVLEAKP